MASGSAAGVGSSSSSSVAAPCHNGPVLNLVKRKLAAFRKRRSRIDKIKIKLRDMECLDKGEEKLIKSEDIVLKLIEEYENLRNPLDVAVQDELSKLIELIYLGSLFDVKPPIMTRIRERRRCLTNVSVTPDDLDTISTLSSLITSPLASAGFSHKIAVQRCVEHARLWLGKADQPIESGNSVSYAKLNKKLATILGSNYFLREDCSTYHPASAVTEENMDVQLIHQHPGFDDKVFFGTLEDKKRAYLYRNYKISWTDLHDGYVLDTSKFQRLDKWFAKENRNCWCSNYERWNTNRPTAEACMIIRAMIVAVWTLHKEYRFHGALERLDSYAIQVIPNYYGEDETEEVKVTLLYDTVKAHPIVKEGEEETAMRCDVLKLREAIFDKLLTGKSSRQYPGDLTNLYNAMGERLLTTEEEHIVRHPSLWHWRKRLRYYHKYQLEYNHADGIYRTYLYSKVSNLQSFNRWHARVESEPIFRDILYHKSDENSDPNVPSYWDTPNELCRYLRNFCEHVPKMKIMKYDSSMRDDGCSQYIENMINIKFPEFLVMLHMALCGTG